MVQSNGNERLTAFVSTIVAVAILAAGVTAHQSSSPRVTDAFQLAADLRFQLEMSFRHDVRQGEARLKQLDNVMAAWEKSTQNDADRELLVKWLEEAGRRSLPGALSDLPASPDFSRPLKQPSVVQHEVKKPVVSEPASTNTPVTPSQARAPITPTSPDPLEEEMVALRQPQTVVKDSRGINPSNAPALAPRPGNQSRPQVVESNLLESVALQESATETPQEQQSANVNLTKLAAKIAAYHNELDSVDTALQDLKTADLEVVSKQVDRIEDLVKDYNFVRLYYDSLSDSERHILLAPRSMQGTLAQMQQQIDRCDKSLNGDFLGSFDEAAEKEITGLRSKLNQATNQIEQ